MSSDAFDYSFSHGKKDNIFCPQPMPSSLQFLSDWAILNSTDARRLRRYLGSTNGFTLQRIEQACHLIEDYHAVYRRSLLELRHQGCLGRCPAPTPDQLHQIAESLNKKANQGYSATSVLAELQALAHQLRAIKPKQQVSGSEDASQE